MTGESPKVKSLIWLGSSRRDLKAFPDEVKDVMGYALYQAQVGQKAPTARPLRADLVGRSRSSPGTSGRRLPSSYTVNFSNFVYVLHAFQKKSKKGIATPKSDLDLINRRLQAAEQDHKVRQAARGSKK